MTLEQLNLILGTLAAGLTIFLFAKAIQQQSEVL